MCLEREVMQVPGVGGDQKIGGDNLCASDLGSSSSVMESGVLEEEDEDADDEEEVSGVGEIPYVDMPGPSLEEELEEDAIAAAK